MSLEIKERRKAFIDHFRSIDSHFFPTDWKIDVNSNYPTKSELLQAFNNGEIKYNQLSEEKRENETKQICFDISHKGNNYHSDLTIELEKEILKSIHGIKGDFNMLLRLTTELTKLNGSMIIFSAYDAYYIEKVKSYSDILGKLKNKWVGEE